MLKPVKLAIAEDQTSQTGRSRGSFKCLLDRGRGLGINFIQLLEDTRVVNLLTSCKSLLGEYTDELVITRILLIEQTILTKTETTFLQQLTYNVT